MRTMQSVLTMTALLALSGATLTAHAAATYSLICETSRSGTFTIPVTSFTFHVGAAPPGSAAMGSGAGRRSNAELIFRFAPGKTYETLLAALDQSEVLKNCRLTESGASMAATDNWQQMSMPKGGNAKGNKGAGNQPAASVLEWTMTNALVTGLSAIGTDGTGAGGTPAGAPEGIMQATITTPTFSFAVK